MRTPGKRDGDPCLDPETQIGPSQGKFSWGEDEIGGLPRNHHVSTSFLMCTPRRDASGLRD